VRSFPADAKPARAPVERVDVSAALLTEGDQECIGFTIRRAAPSARSADTLFPTLGIGLERLAERIGDLPLAGLLLEAGALAERHFVELALARAGGDADAAAHLLGVSPERLTNGLTSKHHDGRTDSSGT